MKNLGTVSTPALSTTISANTDNMAASLFNRISSNAGNQITGFVSGPDGETIIVKNVGSNYFILKHQSGSSSSANRLYMSNAADLYLYPNQHVLFVYDSTGGFWYTTVGLPLNSYIVGYGLTFSSITAVLVGPSVGTAGFCLDSTNAVGITLASRATVTITTNAAISGNDSFTGPGTATVSNGGTSVSGSSTTFFTSFGTRAGTGTISSSAGTVTGTGTAFLSQLCVGDLIGNTTSGYFQVTAIASDVSCTIVSTPGTPFSTSAFNVIENPTITCNTNTTVQVTAIASNTALTISTGASGAQTSQTYFLGRLASASTVPATNIENLFVWVGTGSSGVGCYVSTQRTTPFGITNYNSNFRRIGSILINAGSVVQFDQYGSSNERWYQYENARAGDNTRVLTAGTTTSFTSVVCSAVVPPTALSLSVCLSAIGTIGIFAYVRKRNAGSATVTRNNCVISTVSGGNGSSSVTMTACDGAQAIDYATGNAGTAVYIDVIGYMEAL